MRVDRDEAMGLCRLSLTEAQPEDAGSYTVTARNQHGSFTFTVDVIVGKQAGNQQSTEERVLVTATTQEEGVQEMEKISRVEALSQVVTSESVESVARLEREELSPDVEEVLRRAKELRKKVKEVSEEEKEQDTTVKPIISTVNAQEVIVMQPKKADTPERQKPEEAEATPVEPKKIEAIEVKPQKTEATEIQPKKTETPTKPPQKKPWEDSDSSSEESSSSEGEKETRRPRCILAPASQTVEEGGTLRLTCRITGGPECWLSRQSMFVIVENWISKYYS